MIKRIFWNAEQARLRSGWRIALQVVILILLILLLQLAVVAASYLFNPPPPGASPEVINRSISGWVSSNPILAFSIAVISEFTFIVSVWLAGRWFDHRPFAGFGMMFGPRWWRNFAFGLMLGAVLMSLIFAVENAAGWVTITGMFATAVPGQPFAIAFLGQIVLFVLVGIAEELFSRGYQLTNLSEGMNVGRMGRTRAVVFAWLISSAVFGFLHFGNPNATLVSTLNLFLAGLFLALPYVLTGNLGASIGLHITWNLFQGNVFGFPVSGTTTVTTIVDIRQGGPELWTGGAFGPEAGLLGIAAILLGSALILWWVRWQYGKIELNPSLGLYSKRGEVVSHEA